MSLLNFNVSTTGNNAGFLTGAYYAGSGFTVEDLVASGTLKAASNAGAAVGASGSATFTRVAATVSFTSGNALGGVVGSLSGGTCTTCVAKVTTYAAGDSMGGLIGSASGTVTVEDSSAHLVLSNSSSTTLALGGSGVQQVGGLIGSSSATLAIRRSSARLASLNLTLIQVNGTHPNYGYLSGFVGKASSATVQKSYVTGTIDAPVAAVSNNPNIGLNGFMYIEGGNCNYPYSLFEDSYSAIRASGGGVTSGVTSSYGYNNCGTLPIFTLRRIYTTMSAKTAFQTVASPTGVPYSLTAGFWLYDTSLPTGSQGVSTKSTSGIPVTADAYSRSLTSAEMATQATFADAGWDFTSGTPVWTMPLTGGPPQLVGVRAPPD